MENLEFYNALRVCPPEAKKTIKGGRLSGFTDINPQYRIMAMTQVFGPCGIGWYYTIDKQWEETYGAEVKCFCNVSVYIWNEARDCWSAPVMGTGGSTIVEQGRNGAYVSDEGYKMALTDALSVAMKALGVAADVYFEKGARYGTKYEQPQQQAQAQPLAQDAALPAAVEDEIKSAGSKDALRALIAKYPAYTQNAAFKASVNKRWGEVA